MQKDKIRVGICGYGNLGKGVEAIIKQTSDMELCVIFTRRPPESLANQTKSNIAPTTQIEEWKDKLDVVIMCGGSKTDLPEQVPEFAKIFNTVNTFDTHADIQDMVRKVDEVAKNAGTLSIISAGWEPGLFSDARKLAESILPDIKYHTFWGPGVSQGHSDAIRKIPGVKNAIQYTIPIEEALEKARKGEADNLTATQMHKRECYVVANEKDQERIEKEIKAIPGYFEGYETIVHFVEEAEVAQRQIKMIHEGWVIGVGIAPNGEKQVMEFHLKLGSNPEFTAAVAVAYARAAAKLNKERKTGAILPTAIPTDYLATDEQNEDYKYY